MVVTELGTKEQKLLDILRATDKWLDRNEIAAVMGKKRLNPHDINMLEVLINLRLAESDKQATGITEKIVYRAAKED